MKVPRRKVSAVEIEIQMRPRGYSNSVRQPLFLHIGTHAAAIGDPNYIHRLFHSLVAAFLGLPFSFPLRSLQLTSLFSSFAKRTFCGIAFACAIYNNRDSIIEFKFVDVSKGYLRGPGLNPGRHESATYAVNYTIA